MMGHSNLERTEPPLGSELKDTPTQFELFFTERIDPGFGSFRLLDETLDVLSQFDPDVQDGNVNVLLRFEKDLPEGVYYIAWEILSTVDGHVSSGLVPFSVGTDIGDSEFHGDHATTAEIPLARVIVRWLSYISMLILIGSILFPLLMERVRELDKPDLTSWSKLIWTVLGVFIVAESIDLWMQALSLNAPLQYVSLETQWGYARIGKISMAIAIGIFLLRNPNDPMRLGASSAISGMMIAIHATASHNYGMLGVDGLVADVVHLAAAALWLGGLAQLFLIWIPGFRRLPDDERVGILSQIISRFSNLALISAIMLIASGIYVAPVHIPSWAALFGSIYGQALIAKIVLLVPIITMAALNRVKLLPAIKLNDASSSRKLSKLRRLISYEGVLIVLILFFAGILTNVSPPHAHGIHVEPDEPIGLSEVLEDAQIDLVIHPLIDGERVIDIRAVDGNGRPFERVLRILVEFEYLTLDLGGTDIKPIAESTETPGEYRIAGPYLNLEGDWNISVHVRIGGRTSDIVSTFSFNTLHTEENLEGGSGE